MCQICDVEYNYDEPKKQEWAGLVKNYISVRSKTMCQIHTADACWEYNYDEEKK